MKLSEAFEGPHSSLRKAFDQAVEGYDRALQKTQEGQEILALKRKLEESGIDDAHIVYMPQVPLLGWNNEYVIEEHFGMKVARLVSPPTD